ncbi:MAG TPA: DMT family transporter, partial [Polyangiaceae bacterium]
MAAALRGRTSMPSRAVLFLVLVLGLLSASSSIVFIKLSRLDPVLLAAGRLAVASLLIAPWFIRDARTHRTFFRREGRRTLGPGVLLGLHFISWIIGARLTPAVNSSLLVNMVPLVTPLLLATIAQEQLQRAELWATVVAFAGVVWLTGSDLELSREYFLGDLVCFGSMILFAVYLAFGRKNRDFPSVWLYMWPVYTGAGLVCAAIAGVTSDLSAIQWTSRELFLVLGLGVIPTVVGHGSLNYALKQLRGQVVGVANLGQVISAGVLAFFFLNEVPHPTFYPA